MNPRSRYRRSARTAALRVVLAAAIWVTLNAAAGALPSGWTWGPGQVAAGPHDEVRHPSTLVVLDSRGRPLEGAGVVPARERRGMLPRLDPERPVVAITDARGRVLELSTKVRGKGRLIVFAPGLAAALVPEVDGVAVVRLLRAAPSSGSVRLVSGGRMDRRAVIALPENSAGDLAHESRIDRKGNFALPGLYAGRWRLFLRWEDGRLQSLGVVSAGADLKDRRPAYKAGIRGFLLDADGTRQTPVAGVILRFSPLPGGGADGLPPMDVHTAKDGSFAATGLAPGLYGVTLVDRTWAFDEVLPRVQAERERVRLLPAWFARRRTLVRGRVVGAAEGRPLQDVRVQLVSDPALPPPVGGYGPPPAAVMTDASGRYVFRSVTPAEGYRVVASRAGYSPWISNPFRVDRIADTRLRDVTLQLGWRLDVVVHDHRSKPVEGAEVVATAATRPSAPQDDEWSITVRRGVTDAEGRLLLVDLPGDDVLCRVQAKGMQAQSAVVLMPRVGDRRQLKFSLQEGVILTGQVTSPEDGPEGPFLIRAVRRDGQSVSEVAADPKGHFRFVGLGESATDIEVRAGQHLGTAGEVLARIENVVPGIETHLEILLPVLRSLHGRAIDLDPEGPIPEVLVEALRFDPERERHAWQVIRRQRLSGGDDIERFEIPALPVGRYAVRALQAGRDSGAVLTQLLEDEETEVELLMPGSARIAGTVLDREDRPVLGASITLTRLHGDDDAQIHADGPLRRASDERGDFVFGDISPGLWRLEARDTEQAPALHIVRVHPGEVVVLESVRLGVGGTLRGRLEDEEGRALEGVHVHVRRYDADEQERVARTDHAGMYRLPHLRPGTYRVRVRAETVAGGPRIEALTSITAGQTAQVDFTAAKEGAIEGTVLRDGRPVAGALVDLTHDPVDPLAPLRRYRATTSADGRFAVERLPAGPYRVRLQSGALRVERALVLKPADRLHLDLEAWPGRLRGTVVTRAGRAVAGALVEAVPLGGEDRPLPRAQFRAEGRTDPSGAFVLSGVPLGRYTVSVTAPGLPPGRYESAEADLPGAAYDFEVVLGRGGDLNLQVRDRDNRGVAGARIWLEDTAGVALHRHPYATGVNGRLRIDGVPPGQVRVRVHARGLGRPPLQQVRIEEGRQTDLAIIVYPPGALHVRIAGETGDPALRTRIDLLRAGSEEVIASRRPLSPTRPDSPWGYVPRTGELVLRDLQPGDYVALISAGRTYKPARVPVHVDQDRVSHIHVTLLRK